MKKEKWLNLFHQLPWERKSLLTAAVLALLPIGLSFFRVAAPTVPAAERTASIDTHIPRGFVLVPVEILNYEALDSIFGRYGVVDLYSGQPENSMQALVARNVRMLRAPLNPSHFAVLVRESETSRLLGRGNAFTVIVKPTDGHGTEFVNTKPKRRIIYGEVR